MIHFCRQLASAVFESLVKFQHLCAEGVGLQRGGVVRLQRLDAGDRKRFFLYETVEADAAQTLQDQMRGAVAALNTGADKPGGGDMKKISARFPVGAIWPNKCDTKHAMMRERVFEHFAITRLKNVERQQRVRKKQRAGQWHDRHFIGKKRFFRRAHLY